MGVIGIDDIKDQVEELVSRAEARETILIEKDGRTVARLVGIANAGPEKVVEKSFDWEALRRFTDSLPPAKESADELIRRLRDESF